ncbi:MAG: hypothetical protein Q8Q10_02460 [bacterium]|nr:hypothetical protein [bacterium]
MSFHETKSWEQMNHESFIKRIACSACGGMTWGNELDSDGCCAARGCQFPIKAKVVEAKNATVIQLVPREETSPTPDKENLAASA